MTDGTVTESTVTDRTETDAAPFPTRLGPDFFAAAQDRVRAALGDAGLPGLVTDDPDDVAWLTGFFHHPSERPVAVWIGADGGSALLLPELERENAERQHAAADTTLAFLEYPGVEPPFSPLAAHAPLSGRVAVGSGMTLHRLAMLTRAAPGLEPVPSDIVGLARQIKTADEIALHREAARITDLMLDAGVELVTAALADGGELPSEAELASHVGRAGIREMHRAHAEVIVVSPLAGGLVYAGANSAYPHGLPSGYRLRPGDTFMLSLGCAVGGRFVEGERTFVLGEPSAEQRRYHDAVRAAQQAGADAIAPGVACREANDACLDVIRDAGLGGYLRHRQGHGIGLGMHEPPWLEDGDDTELRPGMVVSNEPGVYVPGHAGYRISDTMLVTERGSERLTSFPRALDDCVIPL